MKVFVTPADIAKALGVNQTKVLGWIRRGELRAVNVAATPGRRPRWRIAPEGLEAFLAARSAQPPVKVTRRRRRADPQVIQFF